MVKAAVKTLVGLLLALLFLVLLQLYLGIYNSRVTLADPGFYKEHLAENSIYEKAYTVILPTLVKPEEINKAVAFYGNLQQSVGLTNSDVEGLARQLFPPGFVRSNSERLIDEAFHYAKGESDTLDLSLDLRERKAAAPNILLDFVGQKYDALPSCTGGLATELQTLEELSRGQRLPSCFPETAARQAGLSRPLVKVAFLAAIGVEVRAAVQREAPDTLDLVEEAAKSQDKTREELLSDFDDARTWIEFSLLWGLVIVIVLLVLILGLLLLLYRRSLPLAVRWIGATVLVSGLVALIGVLVGKDKIAEAIQEHSDLDAPITEVVVSLARSMSDDLFGSLTIQTSVIAGLGFALVVASFLLRPRPTPGAGSGAGEADRGR